MKVILIGLLLASSVSYADQRDYLAENPELSKLLEKETGYKCASNTYVSKQQEDMTPGQELSLLKYYSKGSIQVGADDKSNWSFFRTREFTHIEVSSDKDATLIMSVPDENHTKYLQQRVALKNAKITKAGGMAQYEVPVKAGVPFKIVVRNNSSLGFEIPEQKAIVTCNRPVDELLKTALRPNPMVYGESITIMPQKSHGLTDIVKARIREIEQQQEHTGIFSAK